MPEMSSIANANELYTINWTSWSNIALLSYFFVAVVKEERGSPARCEAICCAKDDMLWLGQGLRLSQCSKVPVAMQSNIDKAPHWRRDACHCSHLGECGCMRCHDRAPRVADDNEFAGVCQCCSWGACHVFADVMEVLAVDVSSQAYSTCGLANTSPVVPQYCRYLAALCYTPVACLVLEPDLSLRSGTTMLGWTCAAFTMQDSF